MPNNEGMRRQPTATRGGGRCKKTCRSLPLNSVGLAKRRKKKTNSSNQEPASCHYRGPNMYVVRIVTSFSGFPYQSRYILAKTESK